MERNQAVIFYNPQILEQWNLGEFGNGKHGLGSNSYLAVQLTGSAFISQPVKKLETENGYLKRYKNCY